MISLKFLNYPGFQENPLNIPVSTKSPLKKQFKSLDFLTGIIGKNNKFKTWFTVRKLPKVRLHFKNVFVCVCVEGGGG